MQSADLVVFALNVLYMNVQKSAAQCKNDSDYHVLRIAGGNRFSWSRIVVLLAGIQTELAGNRKIHRRIRTTNSPDCLQS